MRISSFSLNKRGLSKGSVFPQMFWLRDWVLHAYLMYDGSWTRDHTWLS